MRCAYCLEGVPVWEEVPAPQVKPWDEDVVTVIGGDAVCRAHAWIPAAWVVSNRGGSFDSRVDLAQALAAEIEEVRRAGA